MSHISDSRERESSAKKERKCKLKDNLAVISCQRHLGKFTYTCGKDKKRTEKDLEMKEEDLNNKE